jgi:glycosyltransferase involved in cell wall biosynthesis
MAHGLPVISTDCDTGPREMISHGVNGLLLPASAASLELKLAMESVIEDPDFGISLGVAAKMVRSQFSLAKIGDQWIRLMEMHMKSNNDD